MYVSMFLSFFKVTVCHAHRKKNLTCLYLVCRYFCTLSANGLHNKINPHISLNVYRENNYAVSHLTFNKETRDNAVENQWRRGALIQLKNIHVLFKYLKAGWKSRVLGADIDSIYCTKQQLFGVWNTLCQLIKWFPMKNVMLKAEIH